MKYLIFPKAYTKYKIGMTVHLYCKNDDNIETTVQFQLPVSQEMQ